MIFVIGRIEGKDIIRKESPVNRRSQIKIGSKYSIQTSESKSTRICLILDSIVENLATYQMFV